MLSYSLKSQREIETNTGGFFGSQTLDYGIANLERCFEGLDADVVRTVHMCCGCSASSTSPKAALRAKTKFARDLNKRYSISMLHG